MRTGSLGRVLDQYSVNADATHKVKFKTRDEYGLKSGGVLAWLEKFDKLFGIRLWHMVFGDAEKASNVIKSKHQSLRGTMTSVGLIAAFYKRQHKGEEAFYKDVKSSAERLKRQ